MLTRSKTSLLLTFFLFLSTSCFAQQPSKIVFFRMDAEIGKISSSLAEWRPNADKLMKDRDVIAKMRSTTVFIYSPNTTKGSYSMAPTVGSMVTNNLELRAFDNGIAFVKISLSDSTPVVPHLELVSLSEFESCYNQATWLREQLDSLGYPSVQKLVNGFSVPMQLRTSATGNRIILNRSVKDTVYYDDDMELTDRAHAVKSSTARKDTGGLFLVKEYYLPSGNIESIYQCRTLDSESKEGKLVHYFKSGRMQSQGLFRNNKVDSFWENYYDTLSNRLWFTCTYKNGRRDGMLTSYYVSGKVKREEMHRIFADTQYVGANGNEGLKVREMDSVVSGRRFDESGKEIAFTPFETMPKTNFELNEFLMKTLRYPEKARKHNIEGRVIVRFAINESGKIENADLMRSVSKELDEEALRVINAMPPWQPGLQDDKPVAVYFSLPITFMLD
jgi:protein TonB